METYPLSWSGRYSIVKISALYHNPNQTPPSFCGEIYKLILHVSGNAELAFKAKEQKWSIYTNFLKISKLFIKDCSKNSIVLAQHKYIP